MLIELIQMSLAIVLLAIGVWLYIQTKPAQPRTVVRLATPRSAHWTSIMVALIPGIIGKRRQMPS